MKLYADCVAADDQYLYVVGFGSTSSASTLVLVRSQPYPTDALSIEWDTIAVSQVEYPPTTAQCRCAISGGVFVVLYEHRRDGTSPILRTAYYNTKDYTSKEWSLTLKVIPEVPFEESVFLGVPGSELPRFVFVYYHRSTNNTRIASFDPVTKTFGTHNMILETVNKTTFPGTHYFVDYLSPQEFAVAKIEGFNSEKYFLEYLQVNYLVFETESQTAFPNMDRIKVNVKSNLTQDCQNYDFDSGVGIAYGTASNGLLHYDCQVEYKKSVLYSVSEKLVQQVAAFDNADVEGFHFVPAAHNVSRIIMRNDDWSLHEFSLSGKSVREALVERTPLQTESRPMPAWSTALIAGSAIIGAFILLSTLIHQRWARRVRSQRTGSSPTPENEVSLDNIGRTAPHEPPPSYSRAPSITSTNEPPPAYSCPEDSSSRNV